MFFGRLLACVFLLNVSACSSVRIKYEAKVQKNDEDAKFVYYKSFRVGHSDRFFCAVTVWLAGGWCWSYLFYPSQDMEEDITSEAQFVLQNKIGKKYKTKSEHIERHSYDKDSDVNYFIYEGKEYNKSPI